MRRSRVAPSPPSAPAPGSAASAGPRRSRSRETFSELWKSTPPKRQQVQKVNVRCEELVGSEVRVTIQLGRVMLELLPQAPSGAAVGATAEQSRRGWRCAKRGGCAVRTACRCHGPRWNGHGITGPGNGGRRRGGRVRASGTAPRRSNDRGTSRHVPRKTRNGRCNPPPGERHARKKTTRHQNAQIQCVVFNELKNFVL